MAVYSTDRATMAYQPGVGLTFTINWVNPAASPRQQYGTPLNLTGYTAVFTAWDRLGGAPLLTLTSPADGVTIDAPNGIITARATAEQVSDLPARCAYTLDAVQPDGTVIRKAQGALVADIGTR